MAHAATSFRLRRVIGQVAAKLRELGVYELPDRRRFVAGARRPDGRPLYPTYSWGLFDNAEYWVDTNGRLLQLGMPTRWSILDLRDTGQTITCPQPRLL